MFRSMFVAALAGAALCLTSVRADDQRGQATQLTDQQFVNEAAIGGMAEVHLGKLAMDRGGTDAVKNLGQRLMRDHQQANDQLKQIAARQGLQLPQRLDEKHQKIVQEFSQLNGARFDQAFLKDQIKDHEKDIAQFEAEAKNGKDPAVRQFAEQSLPTLREHLKLAQSALGQNTNTREAVPSRVPNRKQ
jgi:putative membrane protein